MVTKLFVATKAFIEHDGKVLILRESSKYNDGTKQGQYDVPGGRVEPGQHFLESLHREILEETGLECEIGDAFAVNEWRPMRSGEQWQVVGTFFRCSSKSDAVKLSPDHDGYEWINPEEYGRYAIIPTNVPAFIAYLARWANN